MIAIIIVGLFVIAVVLGSMYAIRGQRLAIAGIDDLAAHTRPIDLQAFQNLIDPHEQQFLRTNLPLAQYRTVQRQRSLAAAQYVRNLAHNAQVLMYLGQAARHSTDAKIAGAAEALIEGAVRLRMLAFLGLVKLYIQAAVPDAPFIVSDVFERYRMLRETAFLLTRLERPAYAGRVAALL